VKEKGSLTHFNPNSTSSSIQLEFKVRLYSYTIIHWCKSNVTFKDHEFKDNKDLNDQGKVEGTIIITAQLNLNLSWSLKLIMLRNPPPPRNF
jgi:hypothetical protein